MERSLATSDYNLRQDECKAAAYSLLAHAGLDYGKFADARDIEDDCLIMAGDNVVDFSLGHFIRFAREKGTSCVMCHEENRLAALQKTAVISIDEDRKILSYEEKPQVPKGHLAVPPFYYYLGSDLARIQEALDDGCGYDAPGSFAAWLSKRRDMHAYLMPGKRYDIGDMESYRFVQETYRGILH